MCGALQYKPNRPKSTARVFDRGGVFVNACQCMSIARAHAYSSCISQQLQQQSSSQKGWLSDDSPPCLGESSHRWVQVDTHSTPVPLRREAVGGPCVQTAQQKQCRNPQNMVAEQRSVHRQSEQLNRGLLSNVDPGQELW